MREGLRYSPQGPVGRGGVAARRGGAWFPKLGDGVEGAAPKAGVRLRVCGRANTRGQESLTYYAILRHVGLPVPEPVGPLSYCAFGFTEACVMVTKTIDQLRVTCPPPHPGIGGPVDGPATYGRPRFAEVDAGHLAATPLAPPARGRWVKSPLLGVPADAGVLPCLRGIQPPTY